MSFKLAEIVVWLDPKMLTSAIMKVADVIGSGLDKVYILENEHSELECKENEISHIEETLVCNQCGHFHTEVKSWTDINTNAYISLVDEEDVFCSECDGTVNIVPANVYYFDTIVKLKS